MPHTTPRVHEFSRRCGIYTLSLTAPAASGLPSGVYPRRILAWMTTQALRIGSPHLLIGHLSSWAFNSLGITPTFGAKGTIPALKTQLIKLCNTSVRILTHAPSGPIERSEGGGFQVTDYYNTLGEKAFVQLSPTFFEEICRRPVPIDLNVLKQLRSPLTTDVYVFLTYRAIRSQRLRLSGGPTSKTSLDVSSGTFDSSAMPSSRRSRRSSRSTRTSGSSTTRSTSPSSPTYPPHIPRVVVPSASTSLKP